MRITTALPLFIVAALATGCGGNKKEDATASSASAVATTAAPPPADTASAAPAASATAEAPAASGTAAAGSSEVQDYPDEVPFSQTVECLHEFTVHAAADNASTVLTKIGKGTLVNLKASHANWMKIEYPSGPAELSPGWVELRANDPRVKHRKDNPLSKHKRKPPPPKHGPGKPPPHHK
jgi:hypothetical protein